MKKKILIIEDEPAIASMLEMRLKAAGYEVLTAVDGVSGLEKAKSEKPDLITLDIMLPKLNGFTVCSLLKGNEDYRHIPIIMLTARQGQNDKIFDEQMKPEAYFTKPFQAEELLAKIKELLGL